jgi:ADP-ribosyl-[dinitrogen reductase] hydrolase
MNPEMTTKDPIRSVLFGIATADALGVPVEFTTRESLESNPVTGMRGYGTHHQPPGTWSDDTSLALCLAEALCNGYDLDEMGRLFVAWARDGYWTPHGELFDIGNTTLSAIRRLEDGIRPEMAGGTDAWSNGNGSLMRILPLVFVLLQHDRETRFQMTHHVSAITHGHIRSVLACFLYLEYAAMLLDGADKMQAYERLQAEIPPALRQQAINRDELSHFNRILSGELPKLTAQDISSSGYVVDALEAALWSFLTTDTYAEAALKAVNLGDDTDTTAAVAGGLAGLYYGFEAIPEDWINVLARKDDISDLANRLGDKLR